MANKGTSQVSSVQTNESWKYTELDQGQPVVTLSLKRPYSLTHQGLEEIKRRIDSLAQTSQTRVLIVTGSVEDAFLADVSQLKDMSSSEARAFSELGQSVCAALEALPYPTIAEIDGAALGGGCEITLACDIALASTRSKFGQIEVKGGIIPGFGGTKRLPLRVGQHRARQMIFTGSIITSQQAREYGMVLEVFESAELLDRCRQIANTIRDNAPLAVAEAKRMLIAGEQLSLQSSNELERETFTRLFNTKDQKEGMGAFLEKRTPTFQGA